MTKGCHEGIFGVMDIFCIVTLLVVTQLFAFVKAIELYKMIHKEYILFM